MMYKSIFSAVGVAVAVSFFGVGCGGGSGKPSELVGHWIEVEERSNGQMREVVHGHGADKMELFKDGTGVRDDESISWKVENKRFVTLSSGKGMSCDYKVSGYELTLIEDDGDTTKFIKKERWDILDQVQKAYERGREAADEEKYDDAIAAFNETIKLDKNYVLAYIDRAWSYVQKKDYDKAIADFNEITRISKEPGHVHIGYRGRTAVYCEQEKYDKAIAEMELALQKVSSADDKVRFVDDSDDDYPIISKKELIEKIKEGLEEVKKQKAKG